jgi:hypothetical protein
VYLNDVPQVGCTKAHAHQLFNTLNTSGLPSASLSYEEWQLPMELASKGHTSACFAASCTDGDHHRALAVYRLGCAQCYPMFDAATVAAAVLCAGLLALLVSYRVVPPSLTTLT